MKTQVYTKLSEITDEVAAFQKTVTGRGPVQHKGICGFDGFIDTFITMKNPATMAAFGPKVEKAAGIAASYESEHKGDKFGGNGPLIASALSDIFSNQIDITYIGAMGAEEVLPIYKEALEDKIRTLHTLAEPAHSDCLEFEDGKIMLCDMRSCAEITWARLQEKLGPEKLDEALQDCRFIGAVNWGKLPHVGEIWTKLSQQLAERGVPKKQVTFFMDLAEFEQRPMADREKLLQLLPSITEQCHTLLSFNLKEAWQMAESFDGDFHGRKDPQSVADLAVFLKERIEVDRIIIHPNDGAACASADGCTYLPGPYCQKPLISIGAGDNFGAGCLAACLEGLDNLGILLAGNCASGHFVRSGRSASFDDMAKLLDLWLKGAVPERL
ncbi:MAG: PfkB family carbohydrate kinase [Opitutales bacterium]